MYGLPVLDTETLDFWLLKQKLVWKDANPPVPLNDWLVEPERAENEAKTAKRFAPRVMVVEQRKPDGSLFHHLIIEEGRGILVFCLLHGGKEELVVLAAEPKSWGVSIMPPGGMIGTKEVPDESPQEAAIREFREETGFVLSSAKPLAGGRPVPYHRRLGARGDGTYWFRGIAERPIKKWDPAQKNPSEPVHCFLMELSEWRVLCKNGGSLYGVVEACGPAITLLALQA